MSTGAYASQKRVQKDLKNDNRNTADLWKDAVRSYRSMLGLDLGANVDEASVRYATDGISTSVHRETKADKFRNLFDESVSHLELGARPLSDASPSLPPARAMETALKYLLAVSVQRQVASIRI